jgi:two-component sensor histidine kinase
MRVLSLAQVFDHLLGIGMNRVINFGTYLSALCANLPELYAQETVQLTCDVTCARVELDNATALGIVITELINNAYLHAFDGHHGKISVTLSVEGAEALLVISDDGVGFAEVATGRRGMGLVRQLVEQVDGTIAVGSDRGTAWTIRFPVYQGVALVAA